MVLLFLVFCLQLAFSVSLNHQTADSILAEKLHKVSLRHRVSAHAHAHAHAHTREHAHHSLKLTSVHDPDCQKLPISRERLVPGVSAFKKGADVYVFQFILPSGQFVLKKGDENPLAYRNLIGFEPDCETILVSGDKMTPEWYAATAEEGAKCDEKCGGCADRASILACHFIGNKAKVWSFSLDGQNKVQYPADGDAKKAEQARKAASLLTDKIKTMKLRGVSMEVLLQDFSRPWAAAESWKDAAPVVPIYVVGGACRDALQYAGDKIDDIDLAVPYALKQARDRLIEIYADRGFSLMKDPSLLDATGLRATMGMLKLWKLYIRNEDAPIKEEEEIYVPKPPEGELSDLDVGVLKVEIPKIVTVNAQGDAVDAGVLKNTWKYNTEVEPNAEDKAMDKSAMYGAGMSLRSDTDHRDFRFNAVFFDMTNKVVIDVTGEGLNDVPKPDEVYPKEEEKRVFLELANKHEFELTDFGGNLRFLRFLVKGQKQYQVKDPATWNIVCETLTSMITCKDNAGMDIFADDNPCRRFAMVKDTTKEEEVKSFILYKMYSKLFKPVDEPAQIQEIVKNIFDELKKGNEEPFAVRNKCPKLLDTWKKFAADAKTAFITGDFPAETPKSRGVLVMLDAFIDYVV